MLLAPLLSSQEVEEKAIAKQVTVDNAAALLKDFLLDCQSDVRFLWIAPCDIDGNYVALVDERGNFLEVC